VQVKVGDQQMKLLVRHEASLGMVKKKEPTIAGGLFLHGMLQMVEIITIEPNGLSTLHTRYLLT
jgi:hypothetical protein